MAEIGIKLKALTGYVVGMIGFLVLDFALLACAEQIANGTSDDFESGSFFKIFNLLLHKCKMHYQHFWPDMEFGWRVIVGSVIGFFAVTFGSVGDVDGDGVFVPMLTVIIGFDPKTSTAISKYELPCPNSEVIRRSPCLTYNQKCSLIKSITEEEIMRAMKDMPTEKAPGVDGYPIEFFTRYWTVVKHDVIRAIPEFFTTGLL